MVDFHIHLYKAGYPILVLKYHTFLRYPEIALIKRLKFVLHLNLFISVVRKEIYIQLINYVENCKYDASM